MKRVILCGLGAVGMTFGVKLNNSDKIDLRVAVDYDRFKRFCQNKPMLNGVEQNFEYILPDNTDFKADLIIIATKWHGLESAIDCVRNFVGDGTRIISLLNGVSSEEVIKKAFPSATVLKSYFIGHSAMRDGNNIIQDGVGRIVTEHDEVMEEIFNFAGIDYELPDDIDYSMWYKFTLNVFSNQLSALLGMTFGEMRENSEFITLSKMIIKEVKEIAEKKGIKNLENLEENCFKAINEMCPEGKTSMLQDIIAGRKTEVDIFAGEIKRLGKLYGVPTPCNDILYDLIKIKEGSL